jgi:predicted nucleic acid-binding protein
VLSEYYVAVTRKLDPGLPVAAAKTDVRSLTAWRPLSIDGPLVEAAWAIQDRYPVSWWDALIVAAAQRAGCRYLLSEDLQDGQSLDRVTVLDPFSHSPQEMLGI